VFCRESLGIQTSSSPFFHSYPQRSHGIHSFFTSTLMFSLEAQIILPQSAHSACVRCHKHLLEVAAELAVSGNSRG
jgi:hypothetical protein